MSIGFPSNENFDSWVGENVPKNLQSLFPRDDDGLWPISEDADLRKASALKHSLLAALPVIGSIIGLVKLFSVLSVRDRGEDPASTRAYYLVTGCLEVLGLGLLLLVLKITCLAVRVLLRK